MKGLNLRTPDGLPLLSGRKVLVLGSAPDPQLPKDWEDRLVVTANGSAWSANRLGLRSPVLTVIDRELVSEDAIREKEARRAIHQLGLLQGLNLGALAIIQSNSTPRGDPELLGANISQVVWVDRDECKSILRRVTHSHCFEDDIQGLPSTGVVAVAMASFLGSRDIFISGMTLQSREATYAYSSTEVGSKELRSHTRSDALVLAHISHWNGSLDSLEPDIAPLCHNWGRNPPKWARHLVTAMLPRPPPRHPGRGVRWRVHRDLEPGGS
jgi:hypothetical protein